MSGRIPQSFIDDLLNRVDIVEIIDARVPLKKAGREYTACCPFHNEKTPSFTVSQAKQFYHCFGCGAHGTAVGFLMEYEHMNFPEAIEDLARQWGLEVPYEGGKPQNGARQQQQDAGLYELLARADQFYRQQLRQHPQSARAVDYLKDRGLSGQIAAEFGIGFAPPGWDNLLKHFGAGEDIQKQLAAAGMLIQKEQGGYYDRFRDRIMFPIRDRRGRSIAFGGRILPDTQEKGAKEPAKYLNSPETPLFHKGRELYGLYEARQALRDIPRLLVVEGYMDVISLAQAGLRYAVATLGTATTQEHLNRLFRLTDEVVFCFDGDRAGREAAWRALENALPIMREGRQIRFMFLPDGEDPDTQVRRIGKAAFEADIENAAPFSEFFFQSLTLQLDTHSIDGRAQLVERARPLLSKLPPGVFRQMMSRRLAQLARLDTAEIDAVLSQPSRPLSPLQQPTPRKTAAASKAPPSSVRIALQRLLQQPELAQRAGDPQRFADNAIPGLALLIDVLEIFQKNPTLKAGALLERYRNSPHSPHLEKLAMWQPQVSETTSLESEFVGAIENLERTCLQHRYEALLLRSEQGRLSAEEEAEFQSLFKTLNQNKKTQSK